MIFTDEFHKEINKVENIKKKTQAQNAVTSPSRVTKLAHNA